MKQRGRLSFWFVVISPRVEGSKGGIFVQVRIISCASSLVKSVEPGLSVWCFTPDFLGFVFSLIWIACDRSGASGIFCVVLWDCNPDSMLPVGPNCQAGVRVFQLFSLVEGWVLHLSPITCIWVYFLTLVMFISYSKPSFYFPFPFPYFLLFFPTFFSHHSIVVCSRAPQGLLCIGAHACVWLGWAQGHPQRLFGWRLKPHLPTLFWSPSPCRLVSSLSLFLATVSSSLPPWPPFLLPSPLLYFVPLTSRYITPCFFSFFSRPYLFTCRILDYACR